MKPLNLHPIDVIDILEAHTEGPPHSVVRTFSCSIGRNPEEALNTIIKELEERFGSSQEVADELLKQLRGFPKIRGIESEGRVALKLRQLGDLCTVIEQHVEFIPDLTILNLNVGLSMVREKLPSFMDNKWRRIKAEYSDHPKFSYFCSFLKAETDLLCKDLRPSYEINLSDNNGNQSTSTKINGLDCKYSEDTLHSDNSRNWCKFHQREGHTLGNCYAFETSVHEDKLAFLMSNGLCFRCLGTHISRDCKEKVTCTICSRDGHLKIMHRSNESLRSQNYIAANHAKLPVTPRTISRNSNERSEPHPSQSGVTETSVKPPVTLCTASPSFIGRNCGKTIPVEVSVPGSKIILSTYAILDVESSNTFATSELFDFFGIQTPACPYSVSTLCGFNYNLRGRDFPGLMVRGRLMDSWFKLPTVKENNNIPDTIDEVATRSMVENHDAIAHLAPNFRDLEVDAKVSILIGRDAEDLMWCQTEQKVAPFGFETKLGWAVVGNLCTTDRSQAKPKNGTTTALFCKVAKSCDYDHCFVIDKK